MTQFEPSLVERAREFASKAHASIDHRRKYSGVPYIEHPREVAATVLRVPHTEAMLAAAWLHDVVEDTPVTLAAIVEAFGEEVGLLVEMVTDVSRQEDGNRATRKAIDREHLRCATPAGKTIKLADVLSNGVDIAAHDPAFARVYMREIEALLPALRDGDPTLYGEASAMVTDYFAAHP